MANSLGIIIATIESRKKALTWNIRHLIRYLDFPFTVYVYNDGGPPMEEYLKSVVQGSNCRLVMLNDKKEISEVNVGCGGARHHLYEKAKQQHQVVASFDDDLQITRGWYQAIMEAMEQYPSHSVFTGVCKSPSGRIENAGSQMKFKGNELHREEHRSAAEKYRLTDWGPLGCLVLCRNALQPSAQIPPLFVREDSAFYMELKKLGINQTVVVRDAVAIHKPISVPDSNLRRPEHMQAAQDYFLQRHGLIRKK